MKTVIPKLQLPVYSTDCLLGCKSSVRKRKQGIDVGKYLECINSSLGLNIAEDVSLAELKETLESYREQKDLEAEDIRSLCLQYKNQAEKSKKESDRTIKKLNEKISELIGEVSSLKELLQSSKENELLQKSLRSQLLAYQILNKKDTEEKQRLGKELVKAKTEIAQLTSNFKTERKILKGKDNIELIEELSAENEELRIKNRKLTKECQEMRSKRVVSARVSVGEAEGQRFAAHAEEQRPQLHGTQNQQRQKH